MPKRKTSKTNSSPSQEESASNKPAILRVIKQKSTATDDNNSAQAQSSTVIPTEESQQVEADSEGNNNQSQNIEVSELNSSSALNSNAVPQTIEAENEQLDFPQTLEAAPVDLSDNSESIEITSNESEQSEREFDQAQSASKPAYKKLDTATNSLGQTFNVREKIEVITCNFGVQRVFIISLYEAADGSIWVYYHPVDNTTRRLWKRGCCRIEDLKKLSMEVSTGLESK